MSNAREEILSKIRHALHNKDQAGLVEPDSSGPVYHSIGTDLVEAFKTSLEAVNGKAIVCRSEQEMVRKLAELSAKNSWETVFCADSKLAPLIGNKVNITDNKTRFYEMEAGITACEFLIAHTGSVMVSSAVTGRRVHAFAPVHIVVARQSQIVPFLEDAIERMQQKYGDNLPGTISNITGPSRTADIEKTLVMGAHGPKKLYVFIRETQISKT